MTEDEAAEQLLTFHACYIDCWRVTDTDGCYRDATPEESALLDRVKATIGPILPQ